MATLSKHGRELARIEYLSKSRAFFEDGTVLENDGTGSGWSQISRNLRLTGEDDDHYRQRAVRIAQGKSEAFKRYLEFNPGYAKFRELLHRAAASHRARVLCTLKSLHDDLDGVWSEFDDVWPGRWALGEVTELVEAYRGYLREAKMKGEVASRCADISQGRRAFDLEDTDWFIISSGEAADKVSAARMVSWLQDRAISAIQISCKAPGVDTLSRSWFLVLPSFNHGYHKVAWGLARDFNQDRALDYRGWFNPVSNMVVEAADHSRDRHGFEAASSDGWRFFFQRAPAFSPGFVEVE